MGARTESEARGIVMSQMRRQLSLAGHGGHMRVLQARCAYVGLAHGAAVAEAARQGTPAGPRPRACGHVARPGVARRRRAWQRRLSG